MSWRLTIRAGARVRRERFGDLAAALAELERAGRQLAAQAPRRAVDAKLRRFEPVQLISARLEIAGPQRLLPRIRAGVDVRGDGSSEAFRGRVGRSVIERRHGEDAFAALRRAVSGPPAG